MGNERKDQEITTIREGAYQREKELANQIENLKKESGNKYIAGIQTSDVLDLPQYDIKTPPIIQSIYSNNEILNQDNKQDKIDDSKTWKETVEKRKNDKKK